MSSDERYGTRDLHFSQWHRYALGETDDMIDLDCVGNCHRCRMPLYLIETARDVGQDFKATTVTRTMAQMMNVPAYLVLYVPAEGCTCSRARGIDEDCEHGVSAMRVRRIHPAPTRAGFRAVDPKAMARHLTGIHDNHRDLICSRRTIRRIDVA